MVAITRKKVKAFILFIIVGQIVSLLLWFIFKQNFIVPMLIASIVGFTLGYKKEEK
ncbi:MAG: Uncharacterised protein [Bacteroidota bacterium]|nr:MAG: Uncharacterised protein [Bacteroidota bacterium]